MATVNEMITYVAGQSLNDDQPDTALQQRILRYINRAYKDTYAALAQYLENTQHTTQSVSVTSGAGTLSPAPFKIISVVDTTNKKVLEPRSVRDLEMEYPALDDTGDPSYYYISGETTINTYPAGTQTLRVRYVPEPSSLVIGGAESTISIPPRYHDIIENRALYFMSIDERDFDQSVIVLSDEDYKKELSKAASELSHNGVTRKRTTYRDF